MAVVGLENLAIGITFFFLRQSRRQIELMLSFSVGRSTAAARRNAAACPTAAAVAGGGKEVCDAALDSTPGANGPATSATEGCSVAKTAAAGAKPDSDSVVRRALVVTDPCQRTVGDNTIHALPYNQSIKFDWLY